MFFLINTLTFEMYCKNVSHQYYATNQGHQTTYFIVELPQNRGRSISIFFLLAIASFITQLFSTFHAK